MLDFPPDWTFVLQFCSFFALLVILDRLLFRPFSRVLEERDAKTSGTSQAADADRLAAENLRSRFDAGLADARVLAHVQAESIRHETRAKEAAIFEEAKTTVDARLGALRAAIERESSLARETLRRDTGTMADEIVASLLGRKV